MLYNHRLLNPTYDRDFLKVLSSVPYRYRRGDQFRVDLLKALDGGVSEIPYDATMQPAWLPSPYTKKFQRKLDEIEKLQLQIWFDSGGKIYLPSNRYDANFLEWIRVYPEYQKFLSDLLIGRDSILSDQFFRREKIREIIEMHISGKKANHKFLIMLASAELTCRLFLRNESGISTNFVDFSKYFK